MASILLKDVPEQIHQELKERAEQNRRSMPQEIMVILEQAVRNVPPVVLPKPVKPLKPVTAQMISAGIREGRQ